MICGSRACQGFHDVVGMLLLVTGDLPAFAITSRIVIAHVRYPAVVDGCMMMECVHACMNHMIAATCVCT